MPARRERSRSARGARREDTYYNRKQDKAPSLDKDYILHVGNLTRTVHGEHLTEIFNNFGKVVNVHLVIDKKVGWSKGFAFVEMGNGKQAEAAQTSMHNGWIDGQQVEVKFCAHKKGSKGGESESEEEKVESESDAKSSSSGDRKAAAADKKRLQDQLRKRKQNNNKSENAKKKKPRSSSSSGSESSSD